MNKRLLATIPVLLVVFLCTSFPAFASSGGVADNFGNPYYFSDDHSVYAFLNLTAGIPYRQDNTANHYFNWNFDVLGQLIVFNDKDVDIQFSGSDTNHLRFFITTSNDAATYGDGTSTPWRIADCTYIGGQLNVSAIFTNSLVQFETYTPLSDGSPSAITIPAHSNVTCYFKLSYVTQAPIPPAGNNLQLYNPDFNTSSVTFLGAPYSVGEYITGDFHQNYQSYIPDIYQSLVDLYINNQAQLSVLQQILASYTSNVPQSQTVTNESSALETQSDNVHTQESSYYTQTNTALSNTGLSNFSFSQNVVGGLGKAKDQFTYVWNKLGDYKDVYLFSMTLAIALMIIRHVRPIRRKKEE